MFIGIPILGFSLIASQFVTNLSGMRRSRGWPARAWSSLAGSPIGGRPRSFSSTGGRSFAGAGSIAVSLHRKSGCYPFDVPLR